MPLLGKINMYRLMQIINKIVFCVLHESIVPIQYTYCFRETI